MLSRRQQQQQQAPSVVQPPRRGQLCAQNPQLVSLLSKPSEPQQTLPQMDPAYISANPNEFLYEKVKQQQAGVNSLRGTSATNNVQMPVASTSTTGGNSVGTDSLGLAQTEDDIMLNRILDQVIDIVPEYFVQGNGALTGECLRLFFLLNGVFLKM